MRKFFKILLYIGLAILAVIVLFLIYFNLPVKTSEKKAELGITYSARYAESIGLDKKETFTGGNYHEQCIKRVKDEDPNNHA